MATKRKPNAQAAAPKAKKPKAKAPSARPNPKPKRSASKAAPAGSIATVADGAGANPPAATDGPAPTPTVAQQRVSNGETGETSGRGAGGRFTPGNTFGFKPGQSGNPTGPKPGSRIFQHVVNEMLLEVVPGDITGRLWARALVEKAFIESLKGSDKHLGLVWKFTGEGLALKVTHEGEVTILSPEEMEARRKARMAQIAEAMPLVALMESAGEDEDMATDMGEPEAEPDLPPDPAPGSLL